MIEQTGQPGNWWASRRNGQQRRAVGPRVTSNVVRGVGAKAFAPSRVVPAVIVDAGRSDLSPTSVGDS